VEKEHFNMPKTDKQIEREFNKEYWKDYYPQCKECIHNCKQSWKILDLYCKKYQKKE